MKKMPIGLLCLLAAALTITSLQQTSGGSGKHQVAQSVMAADAAPAPVTVGTVGNEPIVTIAPDGTLYISALQHFYRSTDGGATWTNLPGPIESQVNLNTDSSISVDPGNRVYFTFDYPYAGTTAVCTSDDKGDTWSCDPAVVPGGTDRMWVVAPTTSTAYEVTNQGLYETAFLSSTDRGTTWVPTAIADGVLEPQSGPLLQKNCSTKVLQPIKTYGLTNDVMEVQFYVYDPTTTGSILSDVRPTGLPLPTALPGASFGLDGALYVSSEEPNTAGGRQVVVARSSDEGVTWTKLPPLPATITGTATFSWLAAGAPGHVGVIYYYTTDNGDPGTLTTSNWSAVWAESYNADAAIPTWTTTTVENLVRTGAICVAADCMGSNRFAGDFITAIIDSTGAAHLTWMRHDGGESPVLVSIRYQRIQSGVVSTYVPPPCGTIPVPVQLTAVASRKMHGDAGPFDIDLPVSVPHGIECRSGGANGDYTIVFKFADTLTGVGSATVSSGPGRAHDGAIGSDAHEYILNLTGVTNAEHIFVTLRGVQDSAGHNSDTISAPMEVLIGDTNGDGAVNVADIGQTKSQSGHTVDSSNFREDVNVDESINVADIGLVKSKSGTALP